MKVVTAWNVENAKPGDDAPDIPMTWPRQCLACVQHAVSIGTVNEAEAMIIADWTPWVGQWVPMCAAGVANHRRHKRPVAVPAVFDRGLNTNTAADYYSDSATPNKAGGDHG